MFDLLTSEEVKQTTMDNLHAELKPVVTFDPQSNNTNNLQQGNPSPIRALALHQQNRSSSPEADLVDIQLKPSFSQQQTPALEGTPNQADFNTREGVQLELDDYTTHIKVPRSFSRVRFPNHC